MYRRIGGVCLGALCALALFIVVLAQTAPFAGTATRGANLRSGPGTSYAVVGSLKAGDVVSVTKTNSDATWYQLDSGKWVAAFLVKPAAGAAKLAPSATVTVAVAVAPKVTPTKVAATATPAPTAAKPTAAEVAAYLDAVGPASRDLGNAVGAFAQLFSKPQPGSNAWRVNLAMQIAAVQVAVRDSATGLYWNPHNASWVSWKYWSLVPWWGPAPSTAVSYEWAFKGVTRGSAYAIDVRAMDTSGNYSWMKSASVSVLSGTPDVSPPDATLASPTRSATRTPPPRAAHQTR